VEFSIKKEIDRNATGERKETLPLLFSLCQGIPESICWGNLKTCTNAIAKGYKKSTFLKSFLAE
jgi:hypothetical protein